MGNINNIFFEKDSGEDWKSTKCQLDDQRDTFMIPYGYHQDNNLYWQLYLDASMYPGYDVCEIYICNVNFARYHLPEMIATYPDSYKYNTFDDGRRLFTWHDPQDWGACIEIEDIDGECDPSGLLKCWRFEVVLCKADNPDVTLYSEPFYCTDDCAYPTLLISSNYCGSLTDAFGYWHFDLSQGDSIIGGLSNAPKNEIRIPAVLKKLPTKISFSKNDKCFTYRSEIIEQLSLKGARLFPPYFAQMVESVMAGQKFYVKGEQYQIVSETVFTETNINGISAFKLDAKLEKCAVRTTFDCTCELPPLCTNEPNFNGMTILPWPDYNIYAGNNDGGIDRSIVRVEVDPSGSGLGAGIEYFDWVISGSEGAWIVSGPLAFVENRPYNYYQRGPLSIEHGATTISCSVMLRDENNCTAETGLVINFASNPPFGPYESVKCAGRTADANFVGFTVSNITNNGFDVDIDNPIGSGAGTYLVSLDGGLTSIASWNGLTTMTITGLPAATTQNIYVVASCNSTPPASIMGPRIETTLP